MGERLCTSTSEAPASNPLVSCLLKIRESRKSHGFVESSSAGDIELGGRADSQLLYAIMALCYE